ncbi:MAG: hypothetical protein Q8830_00705 [Candidatus Phytoplasma australasiaticum]|nr:hypothetical protein [Candidatus Phytoplasma australasiaticum]
MILNFLNYIFNSKKDLEKQIFFIYFCFFDIFYKYFNLLNIHC